MLIFFTVGWSFYTATKIDIRMTQRDIAHNYPLPATLLYISKSVLWVAGKTVSTALES